MLLDSDDIESMFSKPDFSNDDTIFVLTNSDTNLKEGLIINIIQQNSVYIYSRTILSFKIHLVPSKFYSPIFIVSFIYSRL